MFSVAEQRRRAAAVAGSFAASMTVGLLLLVAFDAEVQTVDAAELVRRASDARAFFAVDYVFVLLYAVLSPWAIRRFAAAAGEPRPPWRFAAPLLLAAGVVDAVENTLLITSTGAESEGRVDFAHALAIPKVVLFAIAAALAVWATVRAVRVLRGARA